MIALYSRVSTQEQATNGFSLDEQNERMEKYCEAMSWKKHKLYTDGGYSGANMERPALQQLIRDVKSHKIERVLVYKLDRLSRSQRDTLSLIEDVFLANGCEFVSMSENFDTATPFGRASIGILAVFAQLEREQIKERMHMGKEARAKLGKFGGSNHVPIGYDYIDGQLVTNEIEKLQIIQIFNDCAKGLSAPRIAERLNSAGMVHKFGMWHENTIRKVLTKKTYLGYLSFKGEWYKGEHEAFISPDLFDKVQLMLEQKRQEVFKYNRRAGRASSYLGGYLVCAKCGAKYNKNIERAKRNGKVYEYIYYICNTRCHNHNATAEHCDNKSWRMEKLDNLIFDEIRKLSFDDITPTTPVDRTKTLKKSLSELDKKISRLIDLYSDGTLSRGQLDGKIKALNEQRERLENELSIIEDEHRNKLSHDEAVSMVSSIDDILSRGDFDEIRAVVSALIDKIEIDGDDITIHWTF